MLDLLPSRGHVIEPIKWTSLTRTEKTVILFADCSRAGKKSIKEH